MSLWKREGCQTESKALEKSIVERIVREPGLVLFYPSEIGAVPDPVWAGSKWLLVFPRVPVTPGTSLAPLVVVVVVVYPTPSEGWGHGGRPWSPRSRATPQGLDQRS